MTDTPTTGEDGAPPDTMAEDEGLADAERVVAAFGGVRPMAGRLGVAATTIQGWKSRGHIPEARHQAVRDAAAAANIDLSALPDTPDIEAAEDAGDAPPPVPPQAPAGSKMRVRGLAGALIAVFGIAGVLAATSPMWMPLLSDGLSLVKPRGPEARIEPVETVRAPRTEGLSKRLSALESGLQSALESLRVRGPEAPDLTPRFDALSSRLDDLAAAQRTAREEDRAAAAASRGAERAAMREQLEALRADLVALRSRLEAVGGGAAMANGRAAALVLAVGALDGALRDGAPYDRALGAVERFAADDPAFARFIAVLAPHASSGVATRPQLTQRFARIESDRGAPLWKDGDESWIDKALQKFDSVVSVRRVDGADGASAAAAARALKVGDLAAAAAALDGANGPAAAWANDAKARVAVDRALAGLRLRAVEALGAQAPPKNPAQ